MTTANQIASHLLRSRIGKICVAVTGATPDELIEKATNVLKETTFLEFRLDYLPKPMAALPLLKEFLAENGAATVIATCRCKENGGRFEGSNTGALDVLLKAAESGFQLVDIELEAIEKLPKTTMDRLREAGAAVIISHHDFHGTKDLDAVYNRIEPFAPDFIKVVPTAKSLSDNLTLMRFLERMEDRSKSSIVGICMGEAGIISRVLGLRAGSAFTFAAANAGEETAPGQIAARTLIEDYRIDQVDAATKVYGVAGNPIRSSLSPLMMNTAFRRETVNAVYLALQATKVDDLFKLVREIPIQGLSVTMPLKEAIMPLLERTDPLSAKIGAVNTVLRAQDGKFYGFNTDVAGIVGPLERRLSLKGAKVLVLGAGGAARAAVFGCRDKGAEVWILNRTPETAQKLARQAGAKTIKRDAVAKMGFDVIINATPVGMTGQKAAPLLQPEDLVARIVFDLVYNPIETPLLRLARQKGLTAISGVEMFVQQGARQFEIWTGKPAPEEEMLRVVLHALRQSAEAAGETAAPQTTATPEPEAKATPKAPAKVAEAPAKAVASTPAKTAVKAPVKAPAKTVAKPAAKPAAKTATKAKPKGK
ncbi:shikimate dehydrogenase [Granulicella mallensis]|uniref:Multifunctional fusion protein n=1 Tax=Granulicella mallensis (strain ATCC BAA-1857 / DSM 23137 / MP5ACTX8) TaxID=682795 RepID=G8NRS7_GRAMM|nr:shikimate dehydrogenase [Granulicella mallensis]AEU38518.1 shikimate 5-dehydrogenase [Granulicella mallensis MP5ACTX8]